MSLVGEARNLIGWDRGEYLVEYYNMARNYAVNTYGRGRSIINDRGDLEAIAIDSLFSTADSFPDWCQKNGREPSGALFWSVLCRTIQQRTVDELKKLQRRAYLSTDERFGDDEEAGHPLIAAHELAHYRSPSLLLSEITEFMAVFPTRWKLTLALRFHAELPLEDVARIMGLSAASIQSRVTDYTKLMRTFALSRVSDEPIEVEAIRATPWEIPESVHRWVWKNTRHLDVYSYLGSVQRDYAADSSYVAEMLARASGVRTVPQQRGARPERITALCGTYTAWKRHQRDREEPCELCERAREEHNAARRIA